MHENKSDFIAELAFLDKGPSWIQPSRCRRPPLKKPPTRIQTVVETWRAWMREDGRDRPTTSFEDGWRLADETIHRLRETEAGNPIPPSDTRTFRPVYAQQARRMSWWPIIIAAGICTTACAGLIGWFVAAALGIPS